MNLRGKKSRNIRVKSIRFPTISLLLHQRAPHPFQQRVGSGRFRGRRNFITRRPVNISSLVHSQCDSATRAASPRYCLHQLPPTFRPIFQYPLRVLHLNSHNNSPCDNNNCNDNIFLRKLSSNTYEFWFSRNAPWLRRNYRFCPPRMRFRDTSRPRLRIRTPPW